MKTLVATFCAAAFALLSAYAQEMPADLKTKLDAKAAELNPDNAAKAKAWAKQQTEAWENIQNLSFTIDAADVEMIKSFADKKFPLDYLSQEGFITEQAKAAAELPDLKTQLGAPAYEAIKKRFESEGKMNINTLVESMQTALAAKMQIDSLTTDKLRPRTFALVKKVAAEEYPGDFDAQLKTIKEILEGRPAEATAVEVSDAETGSTNTPDKPLTHRELDAIAREMFSTQTYMTDGEKSVTAVFTEIQGKRVMLVPFRNFLPGTTLSNVRGEQLEYNEKEIYVSKELPFVIIFPKNVPESCKNAVFINDKQYKELPGTTQYIVGQLKQKTVSYPIKINSVKSTTITSATNLPPNFCVGTLVVNPTTRETVSILIETPVKLRKVNWMDRSEVNRMIRYLENDYIPLQAIRLDVFKRWEKFSPEKYYEQKAYIERIKGITDSYLKFFTTKNLSDCEMLPFLGETIRKHLKELKSRMDKPLFERKYKIFMMDMSTIAKHELRNTSNMDFYSVFTSEIGLHKDILEQVIKTYEKASKGQAYIGLVQEDIKKAQGWQ